MIVKDAVVAPGVKVTDAGAESGEGAVIVHVYPLGAGPSRVMVPVTLAPPTKDLGVTFNVAIGARTVTVLEEVPFNVPVTRTATLVPTA